MLGHRLRRWPNMEPVKIDWDRNLGSTVQNLQKNRPGVSYQFL